MATPNPHHPTDELLSWDASCARRNDGGITRRRDRAEHELRASLATMPRGSVGTVSRVQRNSGGTLDYLETLVKLRRDERTGDVVTMKPPPDWRDEIIISGRL